MTLKAWPSLFTYKPWKSPPSGQAAPACAAQGLPLTESRLLLRWQDVWQTRAGGLHSLVSSP